MIFYLKGRRPMHAHTHQRYTHHFLLCIALCITKWKWQRTLWCVATRAIVLSFVVLVASAYVKKCERSVCTRRNEELVSKKKMKKICSKTRWRDVCTLYRVMYRDSRLCRIELLSDFSVRLIQYSTLYYLLECNWIGNTRVLTLSPIVRRRINNNNSGD